MINHLEKRKRRIDAIKLISKLNQSTERLVFIHYSCESFYDREDVSSPRITSIAVRLYKLGQTKSFSIHKIAEVKKLGIEQIEEQYDALEKEMLEDFFQFASDHKESYWVHWNMRNSNYGFDAIEHRYSVLTGEAKNLNIREWNRFDLARTLVARFGTNYVGHPRLEKLMKLNNITDMNFLTGKEEAAAFENKEYTRLHLSTLRKVDNLANIFERLVLGNLKTQCRWYEIYGVHPNIVIDLIKTHVVFSFLTIIATLYGATSCIKWIVKLIMSDVDNTNV